MKTHALNQYDNYAVYSSPEAFETTFSTLVTCLKTELNELNAVMRYFERRIFATKNVHEKKAMLAILKAYKAKKKAVTHQLTEMNDASSF